MLEDAKYDFNLEVSKEMAILLIGAAGLIGILLLIRSSALGAAILPF